MGQLDSYVIYVAILNAQNATKINRVEDVEGIIGIATNMTLIRNNNEFKILIEIKLVKEN